MPRRLLPVLLILAATALPATASNTSLTSQLRLKAGLPAVQTDPALERAARRQAEHMARIGTIGHQGPRGDGILQRARAAGYNACRVAENVAMGHRSEREVMQGWMNSPGHRKNILNRHIREVGMASARGRDGRIYWAMMLAAPCR
jgi:uncharacterized protein YkwD